MSNKPQHSQRVLDAIRRLVRYLRLFDVTIRAETGLSAAQLSALTAVSRLPAASLNQVAARTGTDQSSVSIAISHLVEKGLVRRHRDPRDSRRLVLHATEAGLALLSRVPSTIEDEIAAAVARLPPNEVNRFAAMLESIANSLACERDASPEGLERRHSTASNLP